MNKQTPPKISNFAYCWFCSNKNDQKSYQFVNKKKFADQEFIFFRCLTCFNVLYYWTNLLNEQMFFTRKIHIVLCQPEIAGNVGTIIRLAVAFDLQLHLIEPFGFIFSEKWLKRSSTNHFHLTSILTYPDWKTFIAKNTPAHLIFSSSKANRNLANIDFLSFTGPIYLVFGSESQGLERAIINQYPLQIYKIPQTPLVSSINLANAVSIFVYCALSNYQTLNLG